MILFQCNEGDFEGKTTSGAIHHCQLTGHALTREDTIHGTVTTVELVSEEDDDDADHDDFVRQGTT